MKSQTIDDILSGANTGLGACVLRGLLTPLGWAYGRAVRCRRKLYSRRLLKSCQADLPVISVGNVTAGGTGKTPMVAWLAGRLKAAGRKPAILTRGYKSADGLSDEAQLLKTKTGCPVIVNADRVAGAADAQLAGADVLLMDDGFQHIRLKRDFDVVLIDATRPFGYGHCLPRGLLRELTSALASADAIVITRSDAASAEELARIRDRLGVEAPAASIHLAAHRPICLRDLNGEEMSLDELKGRAVFAFCGIGNPQAFYRTLTDLGANVVGRQALADHTTYAAGVVADISAAADRCEAEILLTTQKDGVKLAGVDFNKPVYCLEVEMQITAGEQELIACIEAAIGMGGADDTLDS